jgi:hypothetical protein
MSIINEALKKTQTKLQVITVPAETSPNHIGLWVIAIIVFIGLLSCSLFLMGIMISSDQPRASTTKKNNALHAPVKVVTLQSLKETIASLPPPTQGGLTLNGIVTMDGEEFALINNQIFKVGDYVEGKRLLSISGNSVELFNNGNILKLTNSR